jgi:hypothetical protein
LKEKDGKEVLCNYRGAKYTYVEMVELCKQESLKIANYLDVLSNLIVLQIQNIKN